MFSKNRLLKRTFKITDGEYSHPVVKHKLEFVEKAFKTYPIRRFADVGACWGVHGGYTFHALSNFTVDHAVIVDTNITKTTRNWAEKHPQLELVEGEFGEIETVKSLGELDCIFMFDVLLHQVKPDWDAVLERYAEACDHFAIYNQMYVGSRETVRLTELDVEDFLKITPYAGSEDRIRDTFSRLDEIHPRFNKRIGDTHMYWQWGIVQVDLISKMTELGYQLDYAENFGSFGELTQFENHGYLFSRAKRPR